jgi:hypothetical protein
VRAEAPHYDELVTGCSPPANHFPPTQSGKMTVKKFGGPAQNAFLWWRLRRAVFTCGSNDREAPVCLERMFREFFRRSIWQPLIGANIR